MRKELNVNEKVGKNCFPETNTKNNSCHTTCKGKERSNSDPNKGSPEIVLDWREEQVVELRVNGFSVVKQERQPQVTPFSWRLRTVSCIDGNCRGEPLVEESLHERFFGREGVVEEQE